MKNYNPQMEKTLVNRDFINMYNIFKEEAIYRWVDDEEGVIRLKDMKSSDILYKINMFKNLNIASGVVTVLEDVLLQRRFKKINKIRQKYVTI